MASTKVVFRVDSSFNIGTGHIKRCLALAYELKICGCEIVFITRNLPGNISEEVSQSGYEVKLINYKKDSSQNVDNFDVAIDVDATLEFLSGLNTDILIVDHYEINAAWEVQVRPHVSELVVIDDYLNRDHDCSYFFNQNYYPNGFFLNSIKTPDKGVFLGTQYSLLGPEYAQLRQFKIDESGKFNNKKKILNCLIYFGGSDAPGLTLKVLKVIQQSNYIALHFHVVIGVNNLYADEIRILAGSLTNVSIYEHRKTLVNLFSICDFAIGAPGSTTWERMCLGIPSILISIAENQDNNLKYLDDAGYIVSAGSFKDDISKNIRDALQKILANESLEEIKQKILMLVDGNGAKRVAAIILLKSPKNYILRRLESRDVYDCYKWINDPIVRNNSIKKSHISWEDHKLWFFEKLSSDSSKMYILEVNGLPVGVIRFDTYEKKSDALISLTVDPVFHGRGYGKKMLSMGIKKVNYSKLIAFVKKTNNISMSLFNSLGFIKVESAKSSQLVRYELSKIIKYWNIR